VARCRVDDAGAGRLKYTGRGGAMTTLPPGVLAYPVELVRGKMVSLRAGGR
jgi:hypothetical protein